MTKKVSQTNASTKWKQAQSKAKEVAFDSLEASLWKSADKLRKNIDPHLLVLL